jgi:protein SCO1/2
MSLINKMKNPYVLIGIVLLIGVLVYGSTLIYEQSFTPLPILGPQDEAKSGEARYHHIPNFTLLDQFGDTVTNDRFEGKVYVADFFFTHCPTICPKMTAHLKELQARFDTDEIAIASYSVDPQRDHPERLVEYAGRYGVNHENWTFLTGDKKQIYLLARNGYFISASEGSGGPDDFIHSDLFTLVDKKGRIRGYYRGTKDEEIEKLIKDIEKLKS